MENRLSSKWRLLRIASTDSRTTKGDISVLLAILDRMNEAGVAWPGFGTIAQDSSTSRSTAIRSIDRLCDLGYLERDAGGIGKSNRYRFGKGPTSVTHDTSTTGDTSVTHGTQVVPLVTPAVVSPVTPELALLNQLKEPTKRKPRKKARLTFDEWKATFPEGAPLIEGSDPLFDYLERIGLPVEFAWLAFTVFMRKHSGDATKKQVSWPQTFRNAVEDNWYRLWWKDDTTDQWRLSTAGKQEEANQAAYDRSHR